MKLLLLLFAIFIARANSYFQLPSCDPAKRTDCIDNEVQAFEYVASLNKTVSEIRYKLGQAFFNHKTNVTTENGILLGNAFAAHNILLKQVASDLRNYTWNNFHDRNLVRMATVYFLMGDDIPDDISQTKEELAGKLRDGHDKAKVCKFENSNNTDCKKDFGLQMEIDDVLERSHNYDELLYYWRAWREATGYLRNDYIKFIQVDNLAAQSKGFQNVKERWLQPYEQANFSDSMYDVYERTFKVQGEELSLKDLYREFHSFVKGKLMKTYNPQIKQAANKIKKDGLIPAHLVGDMYGTHWDYILNLVKPFPDALVINITDALIEKGIKPVRMYKMAEEFIKSMGFDPVPEKFWKYSLFEEPDDREVACHGMAFDMIGKDDYRTLTCAKVRDHDFLGAHNQMGHIAYFMQFKNHPYAYRKEANPGFAYAIGELMKLAASTPSHLRKLGLLKPEKKSPGDSVTIDGTDYKKSDINYLMKQALYYVAFLPNCLTMETWRWKFITGETNANVLNQEYWRERNLLQGLEAPISRSEEDLDPLGKHQIANHDSNIRSFFGFIVQYQFYETLCQKSGQFNPDDCDEKPLYDCDFSLGGESAAKPLRDMMKKGSTEHWTIALKTLTGTTELSGESMLKYFLPLYKYMKQQNTENGIRTWKT